MSDIKDNKVYKFYNKENELLYVGITNNIRMRFNQHKKDKTWWNEIFSKHISEKITRNTAHIYEIYYISKLKPKYNIIFNSGGNVDIILPDLQFKEHVKKSKGRTANLDINKLISLFRDGEQIVNISKELNVTRCYVLRKLTELGEKIKIEPFKNMTNDILRWLKIELTKYLDKKQCVTQDEIYELIHKQFSKKSARKFDYSDEMFLLNNDLKRLRTNKIIKEQYHIETKGYPYIFIKNYTN